MPRAKTAKPGKISVPTLAAVEAKLGPAATWAGNCYSIASACVKLGLIKGEAVYGHWLGPVAPNSFFASRMGQPFIRHGWVCVEPNLIFDPTRWTITGEEPYLYFGPNNGEYDEGGNKLLLQHQEPPPAFDPNNPNIFNFDGDTLPERPWTHVEQLLGPNYLATVSEESYSPGNLTIDQIRWLANLSYDVLQPHAKAIYAAIANVGLRALIPIDNFRRAQRKD